MNLAGVERVLELEEKLDRARRRVDALERRARAAGRDRRPDRRGPPRGARRARAAEAHPRPRPDTPAAGDPRARAGAPGAARSAPHPGRARPRRRAAPPLSPRGRAASALTGWVGCRRCGR